MSFAGVEKDVAIPRGLQPGYEARIEDRCNGPSPRRLAADRPLDQYEELWRVGIDRTTSCR